MIETTCEERGLCCNSCQEDVNVHRCEYCMQRFDDGDVILCKSNSTFDSKHWHKDCLKQPGGEIIVDESKLEISAEDLKKIAEPKAVEGKGKIWNSWEDKND